jgi:hypothetical protein
MVAFASYAARPNSLLMNRPERPHHPWRYCQVNWLMVRDYFSVSQIIPYQDTNLERLYIFVRHLGAKLPRRRGGHAYQFDDDVRLEYYRLQKISEGLINLREGNVIPLDGPSEVGTGYLFGVYCVSL